MFLNLNNKLLIKKTFKSLDHGKYEKKNILNKNPSFLFFSDTKSNAPNKTLKVILKQNNHLISKNKFVPKNVIYPYRMLLL